jgi:hypothetical protein
MKTNGKGKVERKNKKNEKVNSANTVAGGARSQEFAER